MTALEGRQDSSRTCPNIEQLANARSPSTVRKMSICICTTVHAVRKMHRIHGTANRERDLAAKDLTQMWYM